MQIVIDVARVALGVYFLFSAFNHFANLKAMTQYAAFKKIPAPSLMVVATGLMMAAGGASILLGYLIPWGVAVLALFLVPAAVLMHNFWTEGEPMARSNQMAHFLKNIALTAALLMLLAVPSWRW